MEGSDLYRASSSLRSGTSSAWRNSEVEPYSRSSREEDHEDALMWAALEKLPTVSRLRKEDHEDALMWAALEKLPTVSRLRKGILTSSDGGSSEIDVHKLRWQQRKVLLESVGIELPTIDVRFEHLNIEAQAFVGTSALPTVLNFTTGSYFMSYFVLGSHGFLNHIGIHSSRKKRFTILNDVSGIIKPGRMTLLLGPPSSGKTTLLLALAGKLDPTLKCSGKVSYNGHGMDEFVPHRTAVYISQHDLHIGEMTVRETLAFSTRCQGVGERYGLEVCADTMVGDEVSRGISGGQKKRVTTGEMMVGPANVLFMDEISTGLDSSTTFQTVNCLKQSVHILNGTAVISLLQPASETYDLFDDIILLSHGQIVYQGPREHVLSFFESMGFKCPLHQGKIKSSIGYLKIDLTGLYRPMNSLRTEMRHDSIKGGGIYTETLIVGLVAIMFNGMYEISMTISKLPVFFKQRDLLFCPSWVYVIPTWILKIPISFVEVSLWVFLTYYVIGFDPNVER
ncbi:Pleiotropic drug resistance protein 1 [Hibiscus syriacus]|uniref:Pleiotropic drug resistance protein 1 n=1 Tax=Hibiscus syriacus TaxID=106335 RepID=A0A6A2XLV0_HIBSY|nr:Pleiotropic drug resistance protein 1 [Hibiscus syriacus]